MKDNLIPVNIIIADRSYRLKIDVEDEEMLRHTVKTINEKIVDFKTNFAGKDMQDYVSMALLWYAAEQKKPAALHKTDTQNATRLDKIEKTLDKALQ